MISIKDIILARKLGGGSGGGSGGGGDISLQEKTITENGTYTADVGFDALSKVIVDVASSGGGSGGNVYAGGSVVVDSRTCFCYGSGFEVNHNLGFIPSVLVLTSTPLDTDKPELQYVVLSPYGNWAAALLPNGTTNWYSDPNKSTPNLSKFATENTIRLQNTYMWAANLYVEEGNTLYWFVC